MKKYLIVVTILIIIIILSFFSYYVWGFYLNLSGDVSSFTSTDNDNIYVNNEKFIIKGVNMGAGIPGYFATDYVIDKETYLRWFKYIQEMGANTVRVYTILSPDFYEAFYEYNKDNSSPLYLLQGVWIDDYVLNSKVDAYDPSFIDNFIKDSKTVVDIIHGRKFALNNNYYSSGFYTKDISKWVIGYILGVEWEDTTVAYTNNKYTDKTYRGTYVSSTAEASAFEVMLAMVGDSIITYETNKYKTQRLLAFSNWPTTDPFEYNYDISKHFRKCATVDVEHLSFSDEFIGGTFASYHVYPYYPDYLNYEEDKSAYVDDTGRINTYYAYLKKLTAHHSIPVVISEFGVSTGRGMAQEDKNTGYNQGNMTEEEQGKALVDMYHSILSAGCAGGAVFTWQDEWFKRTWNTMQNVDLNFTPYWSDVQTNEQFFGLLAFDPGNDSSIVYVDGDVSEWTDSDIITNSGNSRISMKYDEKYIYFLVNITDYDGTSKIYIPIDTTQNSGSKITNISSNTYDRDIDFLIEIDGKDNSRIYVQEYYDALLAMFSDNINTSNIYLNPPKANTTNFNQIKLILQTTTIENEADSVLYEVYETGKLRHGNANPSSDDYDSLADFIISGDYIELRVPWQILNFSNPSKMMIHDDYYKKYGVENMQIDRMYIGAGLSAEQLIKLNEVALKGWGTNVTYHERLKKSYYILKNYWTSGDIK